MHSLGQDVVREVLDEKLKPSNFKIWLKTLGNVSLFILVELLGYIICLVMSGIFFIGAIILCKVAYSHFIINSVLFSVFGLILVLLLIYFGWRISSEISSVLAESEIDYKLADYLGPFYLIYIEVVESRYFWRDIPFAWGCYYNKIKSQAFA